MDMQDSRSGIEEVFLYTPFSFSIDLPVSAVEGSAPADSEA
jgi:hypothetical protein